MAHHPIYKSPFKVAFQFNKAVSSIPYVLSNVIIRLFDASLEAAESFGLGS